MYHRWFPSFSGQCIHITGTHRKSCFLLGLAAYTLHICAKKCIHTGNTDHHHGRFLLKTFADFFHCFWDFLKMTSCHNISFVHHQIKKSVVIFPHGTDQRRISPTASRSHDQHDRTRNCQPCSLDSEPFCSRRVKGKGRRRTVNKMHI